MSAVSAAVSLSQEQVRKPMTVIARVMFRFMQWAARNGLAEHTDAGSSDANSAQQRRRKTGVRGETFAYWYLRRLGYIMIARNFRAAGLKGEIDLVGYDGDVLTFVEVKTRTGDPGRFGLPEDAVTPDKRHYVSRIAQQFRVERRLRKAPYRFDVIAIHSRPGRSPVVRLHKGAFTD